MIWCIQENNNVIIVCITLANGKRDKKKEIVYLNKFYYTKKVHNLCQTIIFLSNMDAIPFVVKKILV